jgi:hypothetical protein
MPDVRDRESVILAALRAGKEGKPCASHIIPKRLISSGATAADFPDFRHLIPDSPK